MGSVTIQFVKFIWPQGTQASEKGAENTRICGSASLNGCLLSFSVVRWQGQLKKPIKSFSVCQWVVCSWAWESCDHEWKFYVLSLCEKALFFVKHIFSLFVFILVMHSLSSSQKKFKPVILVVVSFTNCQKELHISLCTALEGIIISEITCMRCLKQNKWRFAAVKNIRALIRLFVSEKNRLLCLHAF